jgi:hypothetical protein
MKIIGFAGRIGSGKTLAASMIPDAHCLQWADPIYRGLAAMLSIPDEVLRDRAQKERFLDVGGLDVVPRDLLRTLGTEWGRALVHPDIWVMLTMARIDRLADAIGADAFAVCGTRFPNEVQAIRARGGEVWWVDRPGVAVGTHSSDFQIGPDDCDDIIRNTGTVGQLRHRVLGAWAAYSGRAACRAS